jgi:hypothetical protein
LRDEMASRSMKSRSVVPSTNSIASHGVAPSDPMSYTVTTFG